jgi:hypothetical protein
VIAFLDADDRWEAGKLEAQLDLMDRTGAALVFSDATVIDARGAPLGRFFQRWPPARSRTHEALIERNFIALSTVLARRALLDALGGFDPELQIAYDYELWLRASRVTRIEFLDAPLASWRVHGSNLTGDFDLAYGENVRIYRGLLEGAGPESERAYQRRIRRALGVLHWKWGLRSLRSGRGVRAAVDRIRAGLHWSGGAAVAAASAARFLEGQLRGLGLRLRMDRAARRADPVRD